MSDELYVGYQKKAPPGIARFYRRLAIGAVLGCALLGALVAWTMAPLAEARFEFGTVEAYEGLLTSEPAPMLIGVSVEEGGLQGDAEPREYLLVELGKHGAQPRVSELDGRMVRLSGTRSYRGEQTLLELTDDPIEPLDESVESPMPPDAMAGEEVELVGEIVGAKCFLGVMVPGEGKNHRDCAALCIRGGIPAMFLARDESGQEAAFLLLDGYGEPFDEDNLDQVGVPLSLRGRVAEGESFPVLYSERESWERLATAGPGPAFPASFMAMGLCGP